MNSRGPRRKAGAAAMLAGPVTWFAFFLLAYAITGSGCTLGFAQQSLAGFDLVRVLVGAAGVLAVLVIVLGTRHTLRGPARKGGDADSERRFFLDFTTLLLSGASLVGVVWLTVTVLINPVC